MNSPKAFISYSWSSPGHCECIRLYAERLVSDGIDIILDQWSLSEGQDKYAFMEKMVTDPSVTHVLIFSDRRYTEKADQKVAGVGTESQIISKEVYEKIDQKKFIPVVCEKQENGEPYLPIFLRSRIWIDFSAPEAVNENWERLLRALYDKPVHEKPVIGKPPSFLTEDTGRPSLPTIGKFNTLRDALINQKPAVNLCREDFIDATISFADTLRVRKPPTDEHFDEMVLRDLHALLPLRDQIVDWLLIEASFRDSSHFEEILTVFLEKLLSLKYRPPEITSWSEGWFDAHAIFVYEVFLYLIATFVKKDKYAIIHNVLTAHYLLPESVARQGYDFESFTEFNTNSEALMIRNTRLNLRRASPIADTIKDRATRSDLPFQDIMQAELVVFLVSLLSNGVSWYPHTLIYSMRGNTRFHLFIRASQHKFFSRLQTITGISSGDELRQKFKKAYEEREIKRWFKMQSFARVSFGDLMNMDTLDTII